MKLKQILLKQIELIKLDDNEFNEINKTAKIFCKELEKKLKRKKISAEVFIGGSLAKKTLVKKKKQDIDIFVRFDKKYSEKNISKILGKILGKAKKIHGSRDYYQILINDLIIEIIPVIKINKPEESLNVTDLSYFHVNYLLKKIKQKGKLAQEIILAKSFCYAQNCYGAESYINGFSGYSIELLICHYGSFEKFLKEIIKSNKEKIVIDDAKYYKKKNILQELNESKLNSPIILIDPTYKERNALAGLSKETFSKFKESAKKFLKNPSLNFFKVKKINKKFKKEYGNKLKIILIKTSKQPGDIAGTKSKKFLEFMKFKLKKEFAVNLAEFDYNEKTNTAEFYLVLGKKQDELIKGPLLIDRKNVKKFKKTHKKTIEKKGAVYAKVKHNLSFDKWYDLFIKKEKKIIKQMCIKKIKLVN